MKGAPIVPVAVAGAVAVTSDYKLTNRFDLPTRYPHPASL